MRVFYSPASPFAAKVRMAARHCDIAIESVKTDTSVEPTDLIDANPLGKIPALVLDDGSTVFDSRVICDFFDRMSGNQLLPQSLDEFRFVKTFEAACDGIMDALILTVYEVRYRPEEKRHPEWVEKQSRRADRGLDFIEAHLGDLGDRPTTAHFALAALLGWMDIRFAGRIERDHSGLGAWLEEFKAIFPAYEELKPSAG